MFSGLPPTIPTQAHSSDRQLWIGPQEWVSRSSLRRLVINWQSFQGGTPSWPWQETHTGATVTSNWDLMMWDKVVGAPFIFRLEVLFYLVFLRIHMWFRFRPLQGCKRVHMPLCHPNKLWQKALRMSRLLIWSFHQESSSFYCSSGLNMALDIKCILKTFTRSFFVFCTPFFLIQSSVNVPLYLCFPAFHA